MDIASWLPISFPFTAAWQPETCHISRSETFSHEMGSREFFFFLCLQMGQNKIIEQKNSENALVQLEGLRDGKFDEAMDSEVSVDTTLAP